MPQPKQLPRLRPRGRAARRLAATAGAVAWVVAIAAPAAASAAPPTLTVPPAGGVAEAPEGHLVVTWEPAAAVPLADEDAPPPGVHYQLQTARLSAEGGGFAGAKVVDVGPALASLVSGLPDGDTGVRVRAVVDGDPGAWSETGTIRVDYPELDLVWKLMALGAATLVALLAAIVIGSRRARGAGSGTGQSA